MDKRLLWGIVLIIIGLSMLGFNIPIQPLVGVLLLIAGISYIREYING